MKRIAFTAQARADVRRLDVPTALRIFAGLHRFAETGVGDVKKLEGETGELRLRGRRRHRLWMSAIHPRRLQTFEKRCLLHPRDYFEFSSC